MNPCYEESRDKNFNRALELCGGIFLREELFEMLKTGNMPEKQFAALEILSIETRTEAEILMDNLTGCDGKIREAVAFKLSEILPVNPELFLEYPEIFADSTIDINANICRTIIEVLESMKSYKGFAIKYISCLFRFLDEAFEKLAGFEFRDKKYTINKQLFKIYWCLEGLNLFFEYINEDKLFCILKKCSEISEYTIREKAALILKNDVKSKNLKELKELFKNDENYYVRRVF